MVAASPALAQDAANPAWTQAQGDAAHSGAASAAAPPPYAEAWITPVPLAGPGERYGMSAPVLAGAIAVVVGPVQVLGFDVMTGAPSFAVDRAFGPSVTPAVVDVDRSTAVVYTEGFADEGPGASATPSTPAPSVAATPSGSPTGALAPSGQVDSHLAAFELETQDPVWDPVRLDAASKTGVAVQGTMAFVGTTAGTVYAVDVATGTVRWKGGTGGELSTPLAIVGDLVIATVQGELRTPPAVVAFRVADGSLAWRFTAQEPGLISGPSVSDGAVYVGITDSTVRALDMTTGTQRWSARLNATLSPLGGPATAAGSVYALDVNGQMYRLDASDGSRIWDYALNETTSRGWPVLAGDSVLVGTQAGRLAAISTATGHLVWQSGEAGPLRGLTPTADLILGIRGGSAAGIMALRHDDSGTLIDLVSPTVAHPGAIGRGFLIAAIPVVVIIVLLGGMLGRRMGPAFIIEDDDAPVPLPQLGDLP